MPDSIWGRDVLIIVGILEKTILCLPTGDQDDDSTRKWEEQRGTGKWDRGIALRDLNLII